MCVCADPAAFPPAAPTHNPPLYPTPASRALRDSAERVVSILQPESVNPSRSAPCLRIKTPSPHSLSLSKGPWEVRVPLTPPPAHTHTGTRVSPGRSRGRGKRQLDGNKSSASLRFGHLVLALLSSDILNKYKESLALLSSIRLHDGVEPSDFHQSSIK